MRRLLAVMLAATGAQAISGLPARLESKAQAAMTDIAKAKSALDAGKTKSGQSYLGKAEGLLQSLLARAPGRSLLNKVDQAHEKPDALSQAESEAAKLDPSLAGKLGVAAEKAQEGDTSKLDEARSTIEAKTGLGDVETALEKVSLARSLLKGGESAKARSLLDQIPSL